MPTLTEAYLSSLKRAVSGKVAINEKGQFFANEPRLSLVISEYQMDECGINCIFIHLLKKRNGHYFNFKSSDQPNGLREMPQWEIGSGEGVLCFIEESNKYLLGYTHSLFVPILYRAHGGVTFMFDKLRDEIHGHLAIVAENQLYTQEWYRSVCSKGRA